MLRIFKFAVLGVPPLQIPSFEGPLQSLQYEKSINVPEEYDTLLYSLKKY
jgi:hypothetical protein